MIRQNLIRGEESHKWQTKKFEEWGPNFLIWLFYELQGEGKGISKRWTHASYDRILTGRRDFQWEIENGEIGLCKFLA